jgi:hypothetical protein
MERGQADFGADRSLDLAEDCKGHGKSDQLFEAGNILDQGGVTCKENNLQLRPSTSVATMTFKCEW